MEYKEKLRLAKEALDSGSYDKETIEYIFPELKESREGEMIRKAVISTFKPHCNFYEVSVDEVLAWFEKRFSKSHQKDIDNAYLKGVCDAKRELGKQGEQKLLNKCMYSKDNYTDEDRKALCEGCEEECEFNKKEEPANDNFEVEVKKLWEEINTGHSYSIVDSYNQFYGLCMDIAEWQKEQQNMIEPVSEEPVKESAKTQHVNETCKENGDSLTQEPASEDLEEAIDTYLATYFGGEKEKQEWPFLKKMAIHFANWQKKKDDYAIEIAHMAGEEEGKNIMKQHLMAKAVKVNISNASIVSLPVNCNLKVGDKVLIIKED